MNEKQLFFEILKDISFGKKDNLDKEELFNKAFLPYMISRYLSMVPELSSYVNIINKFQGVLDKKQIYHLLVSVIPKKHRFFKYIKKSKEVDIGEIANYFEISLKEAIEYIKLNPHLRKEVKSQFGGLKLR